MSAATASDPRHQQYREQARALWPGDPPGGIDGAEFWNGELARLTGVQRPSITWFPAPDSDCAATVLLAPGGAMRFLSVDSEGWAVAEALNLLGIHAAVLCYRHAGQGVDDPLPPRAARAVADARRAIATVRVRGRGVGVCGDHVAFLGFSAGALVGQLSVTDYERSADPSGDEVATAPTRPDSLGLLYPAPLARLGEVAPSLPDDCPPVFLSGVVDDEPERRARNLAPELWRREIPCEVHEFRCGSHGHGLADGVPSTAHWLECYAEWLRATVTATA